MQGVVDDGEPLPCILQHVLCFCFIDSPFFHTQILPPFS